jgi:hypothetical protein
MATTNINKLKQTVTELILLVETLREEKAVLASEKDEAVKKLNDTCRDFVVISDILGDEFYDSYEMQWDNEQAEKAYKICESHYSDNDLR